MITLTAEQAQQIEEALAMHANGCGSIIHTKMAYDTIRAARAQQQYSFATNCPKCKSEISHWSWCPDFVQPVSQKQEPVAVVVLETDYDTVGSALSNRKSIVPYKPISNLEAGTKLYAAPVRTKDLTDDEIDSVLWIGGLTEKNIRKFARAVIASDREKNRG